jgi:K+-sensing histidine kinase KdpD
VLVPIVLGWLRLKGEQLGLYGTHAGIALMVGLTILTFVGAVLFVSRSLETLELERREVEKEVRHAAEMTAALSRAASLEEVVDATLASGLRALGAASGGFLLLSEDGQQLAMVGTRGYAAEVTKRYATLPVQSPLPASDAVRTRTPLFLEDSAAYTRHYPQVPPGQYANHQAWAALPLMGKERMLGVVALSFASPQRFDTPSARAHAPARLAVRQALDRALLFESEKAARALAEEAIRVRDDFVSAASHELRTPIAALRLQLEILRRTTTTPGSAHSALIERVGKAQPAGGPAHGAGGAPAGCVAAQRRPAAAGAGRV